MEAVVWEKLDTFSKITFLVGAREICWSYKKIYPNKNWNKRIKEIEARINRLITLTEEKGNE